MRIVFCGVGAVGSTAALFCRNLEAELVFVDFDRVESKNLLSQSFVKASIGKNKAEALKLQLATFHGRKAEAFGVRLVEANAEALLGSSGLLVDAFDNEQSRLALSAYARKANKALVHAALAADGAFGLVRWDPRFVADREDTPGEATCEGGGHLPMIALLSAALARTIQDFVTSGEQRDSMIHLSSVEPST